MNNKILDILKAIKDPKQFVLQQAQITNNPILNNLIQMAQSNDKKGVEQFAKNLLKEQGKNYDDIISFLK